MEYLYLFKLAKIKVEMRRDKKRKLDCSLEKRKYRLDTPPKKKNGSFLAMYYYSILQYVIDQN